jgi:hypothetical protein
LYAVLQSLFHGGEEAVPLKADFHISELTVPAGLLLVASLNLNLFASRLSIRKAPVSTPNSAHSPSS